MASSGQIKIASRLASKQKSNSITIEIFNNNGCREKRKGKKQEKEWEQKNDQAGAELLGKLIKFDKKTELKEKKSQTLDLKCSKTVRKKKIRRC